MIDLEVRDLTKTPNEDGFIDFIALTNPQWEEVKALIEQLKENKNE